MIHELPPDFGPAFRFLERTPDQSLMLLRSLRLGARTGFAVLVDNPDNTSAVMLVERPNWKKTQIPPTRIMIDAVDVRSAVSLISWLPHVAHVRFFSYRSWLHDLLLTLVHAERVQQKVHCLIQRRQFRPSRHQHEVEEITPDRLGQLEEAELAHVLNPGDRLFGIVEHGRLLAGAALAQPDGPYVSVRGVFTREESRGCGRGSAVLSAATAAGLKAGKVVSYGLPVEDVPSLHLIAGLGYFPSCREWMIEGHPKR